MNNSNIEIERKYLCHSIQPDYFKSVDVVMGYFKNEDKVAIRVVALVNKQTNAKYGKVTFKSPGTLIRSEFEFNIDYNQASEMLDKLTCGKIYKTRYYYKLDDLILEIDEFYDKNQGLILAEIELPSIETKFNVPGFLYKEVTEDERFYNANLAWNPYTTW